MQKRTFLSNQQLIKHVTEGKHAIPLGGKYSSVCTDYVLEKKREKAVNKLRELSLRFNDKTLRKKYMVYIIDMTIQELINFIEFVFLTISHVNNFFVKQRTDH